MPVITKFLNFMHSTEIMDLNGKEILHKKIHIVKLGLKIFLEYWAKEKLQNAVESRLLKP